MTMPPRTNCLVILLTCVFFSQIRAQETVLHLAHDSKNRNFAADNSLIVASDGAPVVKRFLGSDPKSTQTPDSLAFFFDGASYFRLPGNDPKLKFPHGSAITMHAWVAPLSLENGQQVYIVGKGRTGNKNFSKDNQNYSLRLRGINGKAKVSFLFRSVDDKGKESFNRWNSKLGFPVDGQWHHVAMHYNFGEANAAFATVDGKRTAGSWDMGGPTNDKPIVDNDEVWIGSSLNGNPASTYFGWMRDIKIIRGKYPANQLNEIASNAPPKIPVAIEHDIALDDGKVLIEIVEEVPERSPPFLPSFQSQQRFQLDHFGLDGLPKKYARPGIVVDRTPTFLVRGRIKMKLPAGEYEILVRAKSASALLIDDRVVKTLPMMGRNASGHEPVPKMETSDDPYVYLTPAGHKQDTIKTNLSAGYHTFRFETLVGGKGLRNELREMIVAIKKNGDKYFSLLTNAKQLVPVKYVEWKKHSAQYQSFVARMETQQRQKLSKLDAPFWNERHQSGRYIAEKRKELLAESIDSILNVELNSQGLKPTDVADDATFLRRAFLDTIGIPPSHDQLAAFLNSDAADKRSQWIDQLLLDDRYADHWVSYWQDVLAENPGILKPKLNNTGPFRFWIYESLLDNKPMDRFVSELIGMKGSKYGGGPAGFSIATQNDVPTAAKANVLSRAFLGIDLTCARCHDSPNNHFLQKDLFEMAAMLNRKPIKLPASSTVPNAAEFAAVQVTLKPGESVKPNWPFDSDLKFDALTDTDDSRRRLSEIITSPENKRFSDVLANRIWTRLFGVGIVDSADDFLLGKPRNRKLLDRLSLEFLRSGYDAKHLIRFIMNSNTYQRKFTDDPKLLKTFGGRKIRTMSAEQIVDSLFSVVGKNLDAERVTFDQEGRRPADTFLDLGNPRRAWQLTSLANERDRPALALPRAQSIIDILNAYGWRESRPNPITDRDQSKTLVQPLVLANGDASHRATQLSDDSSLTEIAVTANDVNELAARTYMQLLSRKPTAPESEAVKTLLDAGFADRLVPEASAAPIYAQQFRSAVSWSNHLHPDATKIKQEIERLVRRGDHPTRQLQADWRERMEDLVWTLINSPEFLLIK